MLLLVLVLHLDLDLGLLSLNLLLVYFLEEFCFLLITLNLSLGDLALPVHFKNSRMDRIHLVIELMDGLASQVHLGHLMHVIIVPHVHRNRIRGDITALLREHQPFSASEHPFRAFLHLPGRRGHEPDFGGGQRRRELLQSSGVRGQGALASVQGVDMTLVHDVALA